MSREASGDARDARALMEHELEEYNEAWAEAHPEEAEKALNIKTMRSVDMKMKSVCSHSDHLAMECKKSSKKLEEGKIGKMDKRLT